MKSRDTRAHFSHAQTVPKQHRTANNHLIILRCSLNALKKAVMPKRRLIYTAIKRLFKNIFNIYLKLSITLVSHLVTLNSDKFGESRNTVSLSGNARMELATSPCHITHSSYTHTQRFVCSDHCMSSVFIGVLGD